MKEEKWTGKKVIGIVLTGIFVYLLLSNSGILVESIGWMAGLFAPLWIGVVVAMILNVPMTAIENRLFTGRGEANWIKRKRSLAIFITLLLGMGILAGVLLLIVPKLLEAMGILTELIAEYMEKIGSKSREETFFFEEVLALLPSNGGEMKERIGVWVTEQGSNLVDSAVNRVKGAAGSVLDAGFGVVFAVYILAGKEEFKRKVGRVLSVWLSVENAQRISHGLFVCFRTFRNFVVGQSVEAVILGSLCWGGMLLLRIPYAGTVGVLVGVTALIPIIGAFIGAAVGVVLILTVSPMKTLLFLVFLLVLQQVEGNIIYPKVVGAKIRLPAIWVLAAVVVGGNLAGPIGMFLGVPAASSIYSLLKEATRMRELQKAVEEWE